MSKLRLYFLLLVLGAIFFYAQQSFAESYDAIRSDYHGLVKSAQQQRQRVNWEKIIQRFERYVEQNSQSSNAPKALFLKARTWDGLSRASGGQEDAREAVNQYLAMAERYPSHTLADDALYSAGQIAENRLYDKAAAYRYYRWLTDQMPQGDMVNKARQRLSALPKPEVEKVPPVKQTAYLKTADSPRLEKIRYWSGPEYTRVVFDLSAPVSAEPNMLKGDNPRIYFDLLYTDMAPQLQQNLPILNGLVKRVRTSRYDEQRTRVVLDLNRQAEYKFAHLEDPYRFVVDVLGAPSRAGVQQPEPGGASPTDDSIAGILDTVPDQPVLHVPQQRKDQGIKLIVVDAGHGGRDPGAVGPNKVLEKNVTLGMAKELARQLRQRLGVKVLLTRSDDRFIELRDRTAYANKVGADLFISLHANAAKSRKAYGLETYFLNLSKNDQAAEVAARENGTSLQDVSNLEAILFDLMANAKINESSRLAAEVQQAMVAGLRPHYSRIKDLGVRQGPFHVLLGATMPSVLVEAAFISNTREEKRLTSKAYQKRVADAIVKGVKNYAATIDQVAKR
ncbi:N-acetylmuramoyl-L-alanine amidase [Malonomonas rubra DSM 5091]|uniref:N-acetylmuramoyl-L-alanine amidase n=1 Tax=Malonomonas rubra DSM 5091 TaxID=1122189 RepID=A0A1M6KI80_MALRU|nr:N-acetylmuramoyl-L-alanine amidase [Malonomonas rubra]SHJ58621.1 N-acetylmuramoyl-L-alanine amidase [Malonomonas rubra DSM 5091]